MSSSGGRPLADRLKSFADRFAALGRPSRPAGYTGVGGRDELSAPLVGPDSSAGDYAAEGGGRYAPPRVGGAGAMDAPPQAGADAGAAAAVHLPTPSEDMAELTALSKEAAEIMWEMAALGDRSAAADEMAANARSLQAQLRGLVSDVSDGGGGGVPEATFAAALAAFDMLSTTLEEWDAGTAASAPAPDARAKAAAPPPPPPSESSTANPFAPVAAAAVPAPAAVAAPGRQSAADEKPLISFD